MANDEEWKMLEEVVAKDQTSKLLARNITIFAPVLRDLPLLKTMFAASISDTKFHAKENMKNHSLAVEMVDPVKTFTLTETMGPNDKGDVCTFMLQDKVQDLVITGGSNAFDQLHVSISKLGAPDTDKPIEITLKIPA